MVSAKLVVAGLLIVGGLAVVLAVGFLMGRAPRNAAAQTGSAAGGTAPAAASQAAPAPAPKGMRGEPIHDPALNMDAFIVTIPADWHFQGTFFPGTGCSQIPFPVYRAYSPDGLTEIEGLPRLDWTWSNLPYAPKTTQAGCLPLKETMSASEFLKYLSATLEVEYVGEVPVAADILETQKKNLQQLNAMSAQNAARMHVEPISQHGETAQAKVRYRNGTFPMEGLLTANVTCLHSPVPDYQHQHHNYAADTCSASVRLLRAPEGKLEAASKLMDTHTTGSRPNPPWAQAYMAEQARRGQQMLKQQMDNSNAQLRRSHEQFMQSQAMHQRQHEQFMATLQRGTDMSMHRAAQIANSNHTMASDWVDYALDQQTVRDPGTGQVSKVSSSYSTTWVDDSGKTSFQTNDVNANPNGYLKGNWTRQQQVHGDGTSK
jgi:hypothetical protein